MKKLPIALLLTAALIQACGDNDSATNDSSIADTSLSEMNNESPMADTSALINMQDTTTRVNNTPPGEDVTTFITKAASGGLLEVELGKQAQDKGKNESIKNFGNMLVTDHTAANNELKSIASSKNITVPSSLTPEHQKHVDMLKGKTGGAFDKAYVDMMLKDHNKDIEEFKKASEGSTDADIKAFATKTLPVLQKHLDSVKAIKARM